MPDYSEHYARTEGKLRSLLVRLGDQLPVDGQATVSHLLEVNEYGLALEALTYSMIEAKRLIPQDIVQEVDALAKSMELGAEPFVREFDAYAVLARPVTGQGMLDRR